MAFFQSTKRRKKSARFNPVGIAAMAFKSWAPPAIGTMVHKDEEVICLYINAQIRKQKFKKTLVHFGAIIKLISQKMVYNLDFFVYQIDEKQTLQLADNRYATVYKYVQVTVNIVEV